MAKHYLVTGGTGFLGAALVRRLLGAGHRVRVLDNNSRGRPRRLESVAGSFEMVTADIRDAEAVRRSAAGVDSVVHLAYVNGTKFFYEQPELVLDVGIRGTLNVLDACRAQGVREFVLASTSETYQVPPVVPTPESVPLVVPDIMNPRYSYGGGKIAAELMTVHWAKNGFDRVMIFRPHNVYGPDMGWEHVVPQFIVRMVELQKSYPTGRIPFPVLGTGEQKRAFVHIDDFSDALVCVLDKGAHMNVYHLGNPEVITMADLATLVAGAMGREIELVPSPPPAGETPLRCPDIAKTRALGYEPRIAIRDGLRGVIEWYRENFARRNEASFA
jgi:dTDP-glucose 4,6-dehydratase/UDP-glucose 4-epimerase